MRVRLRFWTAMTCLFTQGLGLAGSVRAQNPAEARPETLVVVEERSRETEEQTAGAPAWQPVRRTRQTWGLIGSGVGMIAGVGMAIWVKAEADDRYDRYLTIADPEVAAKAFNAAQRYDRATLIGWAMAQISFVSLVYFLTREGTRTLVPGQGEALIEPSEDGVRVGIRLRP